MKIKIIRSHNEYAPLRSLLKIALESGNANGDEFIKIVVRDAQRLVRDNNSRYQVDRRLYVYSSELSKIQRSKLEAMNPDHLRLQDLREIFNFLK